MERECPFCKRLVTIIDDGTLATHRPGPDGEFICSGSADKSMVRAAKHIVIQDFDECRTDADPGL